MIYNTVYKITNQINGKFYYGVHRTDNLYDNYLGSGNLIRLAVKKYGKENFKKEILFICDTYQDALKFEQSFVTNELVCNKKCYNLINGGRGCFNPGNVTWNTGKKMSKEICLKLSISHRGKKQSQETIQKRLKTMGSVWNKGKKMPFPPWSKGKHLSEETKEKLRKANIGKRYSKEVNKKKGVKGWSKGFRWKEGDGKVAIYQYNLQGEFIKEWDSIKSAAEGLSLRNSGICNCLKGKNKRTGEFIFKYKAAS